MKDLPRAEIAFCGMGGESYGYQEAGYEIEVGMDLSDVALKTYNKYIGKGKKVDLSNYFPGKRDFDVIVVGGSPCQDFSIANKKRNIYSKRSQLVLDFCRIVKAVQPEAFVFENVIHLSKWAEAALLEMPKYKVTKNVVDTSEYGVPQKRRRKIFIGCKRRHLKLESPMLRPVTVREAFSEIPENWGFTKHRPETIERFKGITSTRWTSGTGTSDYAGTVRLTWDKPAIGVTNVKKFYILHPSEQRVISLGEALALQSFPPWYIPEGTDSQKAIQIADAIPPLFAYHVANQLKKGLN